jgi:hypothetical protein
MGQAGGICPGVVEGGVSRGMGVRRDICCSRRCKLVLLLHRQQESWGRLSKELAWK